MANNSELWPLHLTTSQLASDNCLASNVTENESRPSRGYVSISETVPNWSAELYGVWNISFFNDDAELVVGEESGGEKATMGIVHDKPKPDKVYGSALGEMTE
jgi:hypothetical protein